MGTVTFEKHIELKKLDEVSNSFINKTDDQGISRVAGFIPSCTLSIMDMAREYNSRSRRHTHIISDSSSI